MYTFAELKRFANNNKTGLPAGAKIALLADSSTQLLCWAIRGIAQANNTSYEVWEADYNQIDRLVFDPTSELYSYKPDYILLLRSPEHLLNEFYQVNPGEQEIFYEKQIQKLDDLIREISAGLHAKIITNTYFEINDAVFGNYAGKVKSSFVYQVRKLNLGLMDMARKIHNLFLLDIASILSQTGYVHNFHPKLYISSDMNFNPDVLPVLALNIHSIIQAISGRFIKCVILDLDNTLWGGVIGDDGIEGIQIGGLGIGKAYTELQRWLRQLKNRGILLVVCSKNTEAIAKEPFEQHPEMELGLNDFALFIANWENKADNIRHIKDVLQISFDSMVLIDDNPFEREMVRTALPELIIPDLPEDPANYLIYLRQLNLFETASHTEEDSARTKQYQEEVKRVSFKKSFTGEADFLASLNMLARVESFTNFSIPRIAQLSQRSNQFNLRTVRYTESDIQKIAVSGKYCTLSFTLNDKFGDHGLICAIILQKQEKETLFIDTWIMSCRVLKRGVEQFVLNTIVDLARTAGFKRIIGQYLPTAKNGIVKNLYHDFGFTSNNGLFTLEVANYISRESFIKLSMK
jgi:FkbH-like protein